VHGRDYGCRRPWQFQDLQLWAEWLRADGVLKHGAKAVIAKRDPLVPVRDADLEELFEHETIAAIGRHLLRGTARDLVTAARQQLTHEWWRLRRSQFEVYISQLVLDEAAAGDPEAAAGRVAILEGLSGPGIRSAGAVHTG
jgi:hypothetical protein